MHIMQDHIVVELIPEHIVVELTVQDIVVGLKHKLITMRSKELVS